MGTVHAKSLHNSMTEGGDRLLDFDEAIELEDEPISKPTIRLNGVRARVDRVHVDGLNRTNDDIIRSTVDELFHATDFEDVILRAHKVRRALDSMGCFRDIGVSIDVSSGPGATPEGLEVTFQVVELSRIVGGVNTTVSENEGNLVLGVKLPNVLGRGEKVQAEYSLGHRSSSNFSLHATKPFPHKHAVPVGETVQEEYSLGHRSSSNFSLHATKPFPHKHAVPVYVLTHTHPLTHSNVLGRGETVQAEYSLGHRSSSNFSLHATKPFSHKHAVPVLSASVYQQNQEFPWSGYRLLDRGLLLDIAFRTSPKTTHNLQWEGMVRDTAVLSKNTSFKVRESSGPQMKSVVRHSVSVDHRDEPIFPTRGAYVQFSSEVCGLGGGVAHLKNELKAQQNLSLTEHIVLQLSGACGVLHDVFGTEIPEHLFLGGPTTMRGFQQRGVGPHSDGLATGGKMYWAGGVHVYSPLPFQAGRGGLGELFRSHVFLNAGCLAMPEEGGMAALERLREVRVAGGLGVALRLGRAARLELNYCVPLRALRGDRAHAGLQFGLGAHFL